MTYAVRLDGWGICQLFHVKADDPLAAISKAWAMLGIDAADFADDFRYLWVGVRPADERSPSYTTPKATP